MQVLEDVRLHAIVLERCRNATQKNYGDMSHTHTQHSTAQNQCVINAC